MQKKSLFRAWSQTFRWWMFSLLAVLVLSNPLLAQINQWTSIFEGVDLLTLSMCDSAMGGKNATGSEIDGFGMLAQRQGAKAVVATLWQVADESTTALM